MKQITPSSDSIMMKIYFISVYFWVYMCQTEVVINLHPSTTLLSLLREFFVFKNFFCSLTSNCFSCSADQFTVPLVVVLVTAAASLQLSGLHHLQERSSHTFVVIKIDISVNNNVVNSSSLQDRLTILSAVRGSNK